MMIFIVARYKGNGKSVRSNGIVYSMNVHYLLDILLSTVYMLHFVSMEESVVTRHVRRLFDEIYYFRCVLDVKMCDNFDEDHVKKYTNVPM